MMMTKLWADKSLQRAYTVWKVCKYGVISGPYFSVFSLNTENYGPEITPYLDTLHIFKMLQRTWQHYIREVTGRDYGFAINF